MLNACERVPPLGAAARQYLAAVFGLHSRAEAVLLMAPANMRLKGTLRQRIFSLTARCWILKSSAFSLRNLFQAEEVVYASHRN